VPEVREAAARSLAKIGDRAAIPALTKALTDRSDWVQLAVAEALCRLNDPAGPESLQSQFAKIDRGNLQSVHDEAMCALIDCGIEASFPTIERLLVSYRSGSWPEKSARALAAKGPPGLRSLGRVLSARGTGGSNFSGLIAELLTKSGDPEALKAVREWRRL